MLKKSAKKLQRCAAREAQKSRPARLLDEYPRANRAGEITDQHERNGVPLNCVLSPTRMREAMITERAWMAGEHEAGDTDRCCTLHERLAQHAFIVRQPRQATCSRRLPTGGRSRATCDSIEGTTASSFSMVGHRAMMTTSEYAQTPASAPRVTRR